MSDNRAAFECALDEIGLKLVESTERPGHWVVATDEIVLGQLERLLRLPAQLIASWIVPHDEKPVVSGPEADLPILLEAGAQPDAASSPLERRASPAMTAPRRDSTMPITTFPTVDGQVDPTSTADIDTVQSDEFTAPDDPRNHETEEEMRDSERMRLHALLDGAKARHASALASPPPPRRLIEAKRALARAKLRSATAFEALEGARRERAEAMAIVPPLLVRILPWRRQQHQQALDSWDEAVQRAEVGHFRAKGDVDRAGLEEELAQEAYKQKIAAGQPDRDKRAKSIHEEMERLTERIDRLDGWNAHHQARSLDAEPLDRLRVMVSPELRTGCGR